MTACLDGLDKLLHRCNCDKICLIGRNGCGKSSLLKFLAGDYELASGESFQNCETEVGYLNQDVVSGYKIAAICQADLMDLNAANWCLKISEGQPNNSYIFLITSKPSVILKNISLALYCKMTELVKSQCLKDLSSCPEIAALQCNLQGMN